MDWSPMEPPRPNVQFTEICIWATLPPAGQNSGASGRLRTDVRRAIIGLIAQLSPAQITLQSRRWSPAHDHRRRPADRPPPAGHRAGPARRRPGRGRPTTPAASTAPSGGSLTNGATKWTSAPCRPSVDSRALPGSARRRHHRHCQGRRQNVPPGVDVQQNCTTGIMPDRHGLAGGAGGPGVGRALIGCRPVRRWR